MEKEIILDFVKESRDLLEDLEIQVINLSKELENNSINQETINTIFRIFHSIKGGAGFLMMNKTKEVAHATENLLSVIRAGELALDKRHIELFVRSADFLTSALDVIEEDLSDEKLEADAGSIVTDANNLTGKESAQTAPRPAAAKPAPVPAPQVEIPADLPNPEGDFVLGPEALQSFIVEADELLPVLEDQLLNMQKHPNETEIARDIYRTIHTFKGNSGFLGFKDLEHLAHRMEAVFDAIRDGARLNTETIVKVFLQILDVFRKALHEIDAGGPGIIENVDLYADFVCELVPKAFRPKQAGEPPRIGEILQDKGAASPETVKQAVKLQQRPIGEILVEQGVAQEEIQKALASKNRPLGEILKDLGVDPLVIEEAIAQQKEESDKAKAEKAAAPAPGLTRTPTAKKAQDIRVDLDKLDVLTNLIGELVIATNMLENLNEAGSARYIAYMKSYKHLLKIVRELREIAMIIRMVPIRNLFRKMFRLVHDVSEKSGKKVELLLFGEETEIDKTVTELISDPLLHLIRNAVDHGIDLPDERKKSGKPEKGIIKLSAKQQEGEIWITIEDDGKGINRERVIKKAIEKGLIQGDGTDLSDKEVYNILFEPGFSTAEKVTEISGRGVGMDVVRRNMEAINGKVDVSSVPGQGTTFTLRIPLTLAIIEGMQMAVGQSSFMIPTLMVREFFKPKKELITLAPDGSEMIRIREQIIPVLRLHSIYHLQSTATELPEGMVVVVETRGGVAAIFVDRIIGQLQAVIKAVPANMGQILGVSGCTILGNGRISLIIDAEKLIETQRTS